MRAITVIPGQSDSARLDEVEEPPIREGSLLVETLARREDRDKISNPHYKNQFPVSRIDAIPIESVRAGSVGAGCVLAAA